MAFAGFGKTQIPYDMFDMERNAAEAKRFAKCERIYHKAQEIAWDGKTILPMLMEKHGGINLEPEKAEAVKRIFAIILWGEMAAWKISAQLADRLEPLEAKMAATSQAFDEARHFYVMYDYLQHLDYMPERMDRAPQALLDLTLETKSTVHKLLGMQLMIEPLALTIFQTVRECNVEPVLTELLTYYERDEARHVGLGMQYLPSLMKGMNRRELSRMLTFQCRLLFWALMENKLLEKDLKTLGVDTRDVLERGRRKQMAALHEVWSALGLPEERERNVVVMSLNAAVELFFPTEETKHAGTRAKLGAAWRAFWDLPEPVSTEELDVHGQHEIKTARGQIAKAERVSA